MLTLTEPAAARLKALLCRDDERRAVRIVRSERKLRLRKDRARRGDTTFLHEGRVVLLLDQRMTHTLDGRTLETRATDDGPRLRLKPR